MKEQLISFETAKLAKEKGFNELCLFIVDENNSYDLLGELNSSHNSYITNEFNLTAPTQSLLQKWLREIHNIQIVVDYYKDKTYSFYIIDGEFNLKVITGIPVKDRDNNGKFFKSYEQALEQGLIEALKLIK